MYQYDDGYAQTKLLAVNPALSIVEKDGNLMYTAYGLSKYELGYYSNKSDFFFACFFSYAAPSAADCLLQSHSLFICW